MSFRLFPKRTPPYIAISASNFRSSSSSSSSVVGCFPVWTVPDMLENPRLLNPRVLSAFAGTVTTVTRLEHLLGLSPAAGSLCIWSETGTEPVLSICSSSCSCCKASSSLSSSSSSSAVSWLRLAIASLISLLKAFCSRRFSLKSKCYVSYLIHIATGFNVLGYTYIVSSTFSGVSLPWICAIALDACSIAASVSRLIFADSIAYICCDRELICPSVCARVCSCCFLFFSAVLAATGGERPCQLLRATSPQVGPG